MSKEKRTGEPWSICRQVLSSAPSHARNHLVRWLAAACSCPSTPENVHSLCFVRYYLPIMKPCLKLHLGYAKIQCCGVISDPEPELFHSGSRMEGQKGTVTRQFWASKSLVPKYVTSILYILMSVDLERSHYLKSPNSYIWVRIFTKVQVRPILLLLQHICSSYSLSSSNLSR